MEKKNRKKSHNAEKHHEAPTIKQAWLHAIDFNIFFSNFEPVLQRSNTYYVLPYLIEGKYRMQYNTTNPANISIWLERWPINNRIAKFLQDRWSYHNLSNVRNGCSS